MFYVIIIAQYIRCTQLQICYHDIWHTKCSQNPLEHNSSKKILIKKSEIILYSHNSPFIAYFLKCEISHEIKTFTPVRWSYFPAKGIQGFI